MPIKTFGRMAALPSVMFDMKSWLLIFAVVLAVYSCTLFFGYGFVDDYPFLYRAGHLSKWQLLDDARENGRLITNCVLTLAFAAAKRIENLRYLHLCGLVGISSAGTAILFALRSRGVAEPLAVACALLFCFLPSNILIANWSALMVAPWAVVFTYAGFRAVDRLLQSGEALWPAVIFSVCAVISAGLIYQPYAFFYVIFFAIAYWPCESLERRVSMAAGVHCATFAAGLLLPYFYSQHVANPQRSTLVFDLTAKLEWFVKEPLTNALTFFIIRSTETRQHIPDILAGVFALLLCVAILTRPGTLRLRIFNLFAALALMIGAHFPFFVIKESWAAYRTLLALATMTLCVSCLLLDPWFKNAIRRRPDTVRYMTFSFVASIALLTTYRCIYWFVQPQLIELHLLRSQIVNGLDGNASRYFAQTSRWQDSRAGASYDEFGSPSSSTPGTLEYMFLLTVEELRELGDPRASASVAVTVGESPPDGDAFVLNMGQLGKFKSAN